MYNQVDLRKANGEWYWAYHDGDEFQLGDPASRCPTPYTTPQAALCAALVWCQQEGIKL